MVRDDDEAWRAIVDNFGERARLDDVEHRVDTERTGDSDVLEPDAEGDRHLADADDAAADADRDPMPWLDNGEGFVPPDPPPLPRLPRDRFLAWAGVFGSPAVLLVLVVLGRRPPDLISYALVAAFVGGFCYLVLRMSREPRDPWDDGAQV